MDFGVILPVPVEKHAVFLWQIPPQPGTQLGTESALSSWRFSGYVSAAEFSSQGSILLASFDGSISIAQPTGSLELLRIDREHVPILARFLAGDERILIALGEIRGEILDRQGRVIRELRAAEKFIDAAVSPSGEIIVTGSTGGSIHVWRTEGGELSTFPIHPGGVRPVRFHLGGKWMVHEGGGSQFVRRSARSGDLERATFDTGFEGELYDVDVSPSGEIVWCGSGGRIRLRATTGEIRNFPIGFGEDFEPSQGQRADTSVWGCHFSPDGERVLTQTETKDFRLWTRAGQPLLWIETELSDCTFSPDGTQIVTASWGPGLAEVWSLEEAGTDSAFDPDHSIEPEWTVPHPSRVQSARLSRDNQYLLTACSDGTARIWRRGEEKAVLELPHDGEVSEACFSPDERWIATVSTDGNARIWTRDGELVQKIPHPSGVMAVIFLEDGTRILTLDEQNRVRSWFVDPRELLEAVDRRLVRLPLHGDAREMYRDVLEAEE